MDLNIKKLNKKYWSIILELFNSTHDLGIFDEKEAKELAFKLREAANFIDPQKEDKESP